jgi:hypothetical protein
MVGKSGYYKVMSLVKQILIAIAATITLLAFGWGSYAASKQVFPDPKSTTGTATVTPSVTSTVPTVNDYKSLLPKNSVVKKTGENYEISFETAQKTGATIYVTSSKTEKIANAMKDYQNGVPNIGKWFVVTSDSDPSNTHSVVISSTALAKTGETYYYVLISYKASWLPYGGIMDFTSGPTEPYLLRATE